jgi:hypothetical protein
MQEHDFLRELCFTVLAADRTVRFVGVIDSSGKLLAGEPRKNLHISTIKCNLLEDKKNNAFCSNYLGSLIQKRVQGDLDQLRFQITEFDTMKLVTIPLTERNDRYLCITVDPSVTNHKIISKIIDSI